VTDREAMQQALDALELLARYENPATKVQVRKPRNGGPIVTMYPHKVATEAAAPLRERLAQPEQEPVFDCPRCGHCCPQSNILAAWMIQRSYATGHGDTIEDLLKELEWQIAEREREACAKVCDELAARDKLSNYYAVAAKAIRARGN
jgi:hypothetical protein